MEQMQELLFIAYLLRKRGPELDVCYHGCREIMIPDYKTPTHIRGTIEFEGISIPVIDPGIFFHQNPANATNSTCILVVEHIHESRIKHTGIIIEDIEEIMNLAAGMYKNGTADPLTFNMRFILEMADNFVPVQFQSRIAVAGPRADIRCRRSKKVAANELLSDTHLAFDICEREKQADTDFAAFQEITSQLIES